MQTSCIARDHRCDSVERRRALQLRQSVRYFERGRRVFESPEALFERRVRIGGEFSNRPKHGV